ncbi:MAG: Fe-S cluster assembly ATPase SufC, partial [Lachnoanaerobaculum saburreum]
LHGVNIEIKKGETHVLMGPNGAGKSTLGYALMGNPRYITNGGEIIFDGKNIVDESADKRAKAGMFLSFQNPLEVPGLPLSSFIRNAVEAVSGKRVRMMQFKKELEKNMEVLNMDKDYANRALNVGFSGGEKKKAEILQLLMLSPKLAILDETDSGLDVDAVRTVSEGVKEYQKRKDGALLIITHSTRILESLKVDYTHIMVEGRIIKTGDASLVDEINENGFEKYIQESK